jgi:hypothetical protein
MRLVELSELDDKLCVRHAAKIYFRIKNPTSKQKWTNGRTREVLNLPKTVLLDDYNVEVYVDPETILVVRSAGDAVYSHFRDAQSGKCSPTVTNPALAVVSYKRGIPYAI